MNRKRVAPKPGEALRPATRTAAPARQGPGLYGDLVGGIAGVLEAARRASARAVNAIMTATYWEIGRRIVEHEQQGKARAEYGEDLLKRLATDLSARFGRGFGWRNLFQMRAFYLMYPPEKLQTVSARSPRADSPPALAPKERIRQTRSGELPASGEDPTASDVSRMTWLAARFPLPWSAYVRLLAVKHEDARAFYETEALRAGWSVRQLDRQIQSQFYCARKDDALARYALGNLPNKVLAAEYRTVLPDEKLIAADLQKTRRILERRGLTEGGKR